MKRRSLFLGATCAIIAFTSMHGPSFAETPANQLVIGFSMSNVLTLDPAGSSSKERVQILANLYDGLVGIDPVQRSKVIPALAESWEVAADRRSIRFRLRPDLRFASGNPVTADDVVWSLERVLKLNQAQATNLRLRGYTAENAAQSFRAVDEKTVEIAILQPIDPQIILMTLAMAGTGSVLDKKEVLGHEKAGDLGAAWLTTNSAGTGAFTMQSLRPNEMAILARNDNYWGSAPAMTRVLMRHIPEAQSQRLLIEKGDLDIAYSLGAADLKSLESNKDVKVTTATGNGLYYLAMSLKNENLAKARVREAILKLIDYDGLNKTVMPYYGVKHLSPIQVGLAQEPYEPEIKMDVAAAKGLLAEAGYPDGLDLTIRTLSEPPFDNLAVALQSMLAQGGIRAKILTGSGEQVYGPMRERNFELIVGRSGGQISHPDGDMRSLAYNPDNRDEAKLTGLQGWRVSFKDDALNQKIEAALQEADPAAQAKLYHEIEQLYAEGIPAIQPISQVTDSVAQRADIEGFQISPVWQTKLETVRKNR
ncbi:ABC transporter substrate-binding protein [Xaviernesmea oryzae]|uniref:Peptide/nickel transport system substrate-binding protein n=1 Tax=Xaviernesmea oryzae TaxID=464029 RepID=A0A1X7D899_9HYPH|nr:ABC transporter substrate-binding protein [Xaviernesmea oryzae]SMF10635.1 peptide/nickel transport system substrate-binding protein [Xaviernesmea oryzae]